EAAAPLAADPARLRLKWPNDLLRDGAKCAGILAESRLATGGGIAWLALGFGVNLAAAPALPDRSAATVGAPEPPEAFARRLLARLGHWQGRVAEAGFTPALAAWRALGPSPGEPCAVTGPAGRIEGRFAGLAEDGSLLLETPDGRRQVTAGEVAALGGME
ncbi:MAG TPA: biotin--[acetyl-CoA-carboxylase] ligase, partial [Crenalkalicoccus sp.]|nr:biotin--[acetyl-CoA-carboxylase] ligase [Crenalkalicoccus sp.]